MMIVSIRKTASVGTKFIKISTIIDKSGTETEVDRTGEMGGGGVASRTGTI